MQVSVLLQSKGTEVVTVRPDATIAEVAIVLAERRIGAVVVTSDAATAGPLPALPVLAAVPGCRIARNGWISGLIPPADRRPSARPHPLPRCPA